MPPVVEADVGMQSVRISIIGQVDSSKWAIGEALLRMMGSADSRLFPERIGNSEPLQNIFSGISSAEKYWAPEVKICSSGVSFVAKSNVLWVRSKAIKGRGHMTHRSVNVQGKVNPAWLLLEYKYDPRVNWFRLFKESCNLLQATYGTLHLFTGKETSEGVFGQDADLSFATSDFIDGLPPIGLEKRGLANIAWANYFGPELVAEIDRTALQLNGFPVEEQEHDACVFCVTKKIGDVIDDFETFSSRRNRLKTLFRSGLFRIGKEPRENQF
ncbi:hypothetical protein [Roseateles amylovorans]|uniref:Uncharacterized protein n=1 Tax=Roseateles amylovorans TaxID=2978473 RepID=A0ABY6B694_9BURK|nr:hypothetical protein [Roseateles amylovorans]UXH80695.1 hypothetical protein N4261_12785 [Roseateles amylovorans]